MIGFAINFIMCMVWVSFMASDPSNAEAFIPALVINTFAGFFSLMMDLD